MSCYREWRIHGSGTYCLHVEETQQILEVPQYATVQQCGFNGSWRPGSSTGCSNESVRTEDPLRLCQNHVWTVEPWNVSQPAGRMQLRHCPCWSRCNGEPSRETRATKGDKVARTPVLTARSPARATTQSQRSRPDREAEGRSGSGGGRSW